jgi:hypothetical protein
MIDMLNSRSLPFLGLMLAAIYLPTLATPFDFIDDGNLVYPAPSGTTLTQHVARWWDRVVANYEHLGPVRPVLWAHWELFANVTHGDALAWRAIRFAWCAFAAMSFLWFLRELGIHPDAAMIVGAVAMWNPYRNEIWTSLTLAEGVAMPYAMLALIGARRAVHGSRWWDVVALVGLLAALGCKNTYVALVPAMMLLRLVRDDGEWRANRWAMLLYLVPIVLPIVHFVYFKLNWKPGQYEPHGPSFTQLLRELNGLKGALSLDYLGAGWALVLACVWRGVSLRTEQTSIVTKKAIGVGALLLACGLIVYLPMNMMSGRYTMPAVWGVDILLAILLTRFAQVPTNWRTRLAWGALMVGVIVLGLVNLARQEKLTARTMMLWDVVRHLETQTPPNGVVEWVSGESSRGELNVEEGIHVQWHLLHRGRRDIQIRLLDPQFQPISRVEVPSTNGRVVFRVLGAAGVAASDHSIPYQRSYWAGRKSFACVIQPSP